MSTVAVTVGGLNIRGIDTTDNPNTRKVESRSVKFYTNGKFDHRGVEGSEKNREAFFYFLLSRDSASENVFAVRHGNKITFYAKCGDAGDVRIAAFTIGADGTITSCKVDSYWDDRSASFARYVFNGKFSMKKKDASFSIVVPEGSPKFKIAAPLYSTSAANFDPCQYADVPESYHTAPAGISQDYGVRAQRAIDVLSLLAKLLAKNRPIELDKLTPDQLMNLANALEFVDKELAAELKTAVKKKDKLAIIKVSEKLHAKYGVQDPDSVKGSSGKTLLTAELINKIINDVIASSKGKIRVGAYSGADADYIGFGPKQDNVREILRRADPEWIPHLVALAKSLGIKIGEDGTLDWFFKNPGLRVVVAVEYLIKQGYPQEMVIDFLVANYSKLDEKGKALLAKYMLVKGAAQKNKAFYDLAIDILRAKYGDANVVEILVEDPSTKKKTVYIYIKSEKRVLGLDGQERTFVNGLPDPSDENVHYTALGKALYTIDNPNADPSKLTIQFGYKGRGK